MVWNFRVNKDMLGGKMDGWMDGGKKISIGGYVSDCVILIYVIWFYFLVLKFRYYFIFVDEEIKV